ncbi:DUF4864 domain-containing protein [Stappia sp. ES.058]|uniref:DUF4864 domain-containing protein n=1 Tax=Stappia sp. ES.058 TaxID=1881061 RepID=UPI00087C3E59|nr:DUF4864 domain-containing protein [Stappia sp. ES.058]SDU07680.1 protein of unknown function [Stappia sp. ES.058]
MCVSMFRKFAVGCLLGLTVLFAAQGSAVAQDDAKLKGIVEKQIAAFRAGDAEAAYGLAAPMIKRMFPSPDRFIDMVKRGYAPVYNPSAVAFGSLRETAKGPIQEVYVTDAKGQQWLALYSFEQQADGTWKISGCVLTKSPGFSA